jgi:DNA-binding XRE family transcriptional regulator
VVRAYSDEEIKLILVVRKAYKSGSAERVRLEAGLPRSLMADLTGCHESSIIRYERGQRVPSPEVALSLAGAFEQVVGTMEDLL